MADWNGNNSRNDLMQRGLQNDFLDDPSQSIRLRDLEFTDLYISQNGEALLKGVQDGEGPLTEIPDNMIYDLHYLLELVLKNYERHTDTGEFRLEYDDVNYRVTVMEDLDDLWFTLRKPMRDVPRLKDLEAFVHPMVRHLSWLGRKGNGLILIAGKTGHGKTTTAYTLLREYLKAFGDVAVTIEDPPEMRFKEGDFKFGKCWQLGLKPGQTFGTALVRSLRMSPKFIFIGELRRGADAGEVLRAANSGHLIITTIHAGNVIEAINSFIKLTASEGISEEFARDLFAQAAAAIIHQEIKVTKSPVPGGGFKKRLKLETLFFGYEDGIRAQVREGRQSQLRSEIDRQLSLMAKGEDPVSTTPKQPLADKRSGK